MTFHFIDWVRRRFIKKTPGLIEETDVRTFGARNIAGEITKEDLTDKDFYTFLPLSLIDQKSTDFCVGAGKAYAKQGTEGVLMSWAGAFAMACKLQGFVPDWGMSILTMMKAGQKLGIPEESYWTFDGKTRNEAADYTRMGQGVFINADKHKDQSYFILEQPSGWDKFDTFRAYLNKFRSKRVAIQTGVDGHNVTLIGQKVVNGELKLFGPDSYGSRSIKYRVGASVDGYRYFSRSETNQLFQGYMSFDMPRSLAELLVKYNNKAIKVAGNSDCYLVKNGQRHLLKNEAVAWANNVLLFGDNFVFEILEEDMNLIPKGADATFEEGANKEIILRVLEKLGKTDLITE